VLRVALLDSPNPEQWKAPEAHADGPTTGNPLGLVDGYA